ncbi:hypothetical protein M0805_007310 [Coniferiporia weirii]|nr:hypothetical protein M0805_007310 [Coniferiporia weirii]
MSDDELVQRLHAPLSFKNKLADDSEVAEWNRAACTVINELSERQPSTTRVLASVAALDGQEGWLATGTRQLAHRFLASSEADAETVKAVLETNVKPLFISNPHPQLNLSTGRALPRTAGGPMASQDYYDEQTWKNSLGLSNVVSWCIRNLPPDSYEQVWHLLIPPVMTFLDDYQAPYKLRGVTLVSELLQNVPASVLKRTGVGNLLMTSLTKGLITLHDALSPNLIRTTVPVILTLVDMTTSPGSVERFEQLCIVLGENIIGGAWVYASREQQTMEATMDVLPQIVHALGIGSIRYLKALIPQCLHCITLNELVPSLESLEVTSLRALLSIVQECQPRLHRWKGTIIAGVGKYWIVRCDKSGTGDHDVVRDLVREIFISLSKACPTVLDVRNPAAHKACCNMNSMFLIFQDEYSQLPEVLRSIIIC